ncbi:MAG: bifunctional 5,10-methylenetetrahydrofolate dehydrogenase/5,10-methenyltetrahydrofolate cyclohydrolase [Candidatus Omnitrophica bacterium]|nr:bifunctional 5,10-methylenetetrahydrofolate dehydrogenase/5,10-methenyltetrahydrofolate cyclohydrolase [Candidatus Omnitrophota bacterium]
MTEQLLRAADIVDRLEPQLKRDIDQLRAQHGKGPHLRILYFTDHSPSILFKNAQEKVARRLGITPGTQGCDWGHVTREEVKRVITQWNRDPAVHGIFVHQPLPPQLDAQEISTLIDPQKDVEGIHPQNSARRFFAKARIGSCTALAVMELIDEALRRSGGTLEGKEAVVVGHSEIVGRPVGMLLLDRLATTTVCHVATKALQQHVERADVLVVAVGQPELIKGAWIKPGAVVIDVGINVVGGKVVGDVEFEAARARAAFLTPVPGGVGPVTVMMVMKNTVEAFKLQQKG